MFDYFGFDPKTLTDDELLNKTIELRGKLVYASRFSTPGLLATLQGILQSVEFESQERAARRFFEFQQKAFPDVIESDPVLANKNEEAAKPGPGKITPQPRPRMQITKTTRPTDESGDPEDPK